jgi:hypothetical protein
MQSETESGRVHHRERVYACDVHVAGPTTLQGTCTCGWRGPERLTFHLAHNDVLDHLDKVPVR